MEDLNQTELPSLDLEGLNRVLARIEKENLVKDLDLTTGDCGCFALALKRLLGTGELWVLGRYSHVVLKIGDDDYVDGYGHQTKKELLGHWRYVDGFTKFQGIGIEVVKNTCPVFEPEEMEEIILKIAKGKDLKKEIAKRWRRYSW
jgi:hypothetical protein